MTNDNAATANDTGLQPHTVETPGITYSFCRETDADLTTTEGRIEWFCKHFDVDPPELEYDEEEPDQIILTTSLLTWCQIEGVNLDWVFCGAVAGVLATYREKYKRTEEEQRFIDAISRFPPDEVKLLIDGIKRGNDPDADFEAEVKKAVDEIKAGWVAA
ncbi:hypothetical protein MWU54_13700 [Marivita sp. S6314]|uniref:hypothetical protein n=1 Tax=Marivita sp. S6314 TaxID=2926406 RepID=UPI001FF50A07|nr:hypothetical protein [Marivita sp. S6314]MCK0151090.1 hypothetical protein [Marivita sp. S6314]